jgi:hypothetical protein
MAAPEPRASPSQASIVTWSLKMLPPVKAVIIPPCFRLALNVICRKQMRNSCYLEDIRGNGRAVDGECIPQAF